MFIDCHSCAKNITPLLCLQASVHTHLFCRCCRVYVRYSADVKASMCYVSIMYFSLQSMYTVLHGTLSRARTVGYALSRSDSCEFLLHFSGINCSSSLVDH